MIAKECSRLQSKGNMSELRNPYSASGGARTPPSSPLATSGQLKDCHSIASRRSAAVGRPVGPLVAVQPHPRREPLR